MPATGGSESLSALRWTCGGHLCDRFPSSAAQKGRTGIHPTAARKTRRPCASKAVISVSADDRAIFAVTCNRLIYQSSGPALNTSFRLHR